MLRFCHCLLPVRRGTESALSQLQRQTKKSNQLRQEKALTASAATSLLLMKSGIVADWKKKKRETSHERMNLLWWKSIPQRPNPSSDITKALWKHCPSRASEGKAKGSDFPRCSRPPCLLWPPPPGPAPSSLRPCLPLPGTAAGPGRVPSPAPGSYGRNRAPAAPAARPDSAPRAASPSSPQSPPPSWRGAWALSPPAPRPPVRPRRGRAETGAAALRFRPGGFCLLSGKIRHEPPDFGYSKKKKKPKSYFYAKQPIIVSTFGSYTEALGHPTARRWVATL